MRVVGWQTSRLVDLSAEVASEEVLQVLLAAALQGWLTQLVRKLLELLKAKFALLNFLPEGGVEAGVAVRDEPGELAVSNDFPGDLEGLSIGIHASDVSVEQILNVGGLPSDFGVEVEAACSDPARVEDGEHGEREFADIGVELIGVPSKKEIARIRIDGSEHPG